MMNRGMAVKLIDFHNLKKYMQLTDNIQHTTVQSMLF